jgi:thiamine pyrophosphate-dependent acetolactate synthase large subunit-like protein
LALMLDRRDFIRKLLHERGDLLVVAGLGAPTYDVAAAGDAGLNFYLWGAMGGAAMIGLGLALAKLKRRVAVITGDGEMLMGLGSLATIGVKQPENLAILVLDNRRYGETGMQASHTDAGVDLVAIAKACLFKETLAVVAEDQIAKARRLIYSGKGPAFIHVRVKTDDVPRVLPTRDGKEIKRRFMDALLQPS